MAEFDIIQVMEVLSTLLIIMSFVILLALNLRLRAPRSFQFEALVFSLVLTVSEIPHIMQTLNLLSLTGFEELGMELHTISMVAISGFVALRVYRYSKRS